MFSYQGLTRKTAFLYHLAFSELLFLILAAIIRFQWYPGVLFWVDGGFEGIRLIAGVDLVLGPLLTLIIFKPGKPGLLFDISLIAATQIICLLIGVFIVHQNRTMAVVFSQGIFYTMDRAQADTTPGLMDKLDTLSGRYPKWVYLDPRLDQTGNVLVFNKRQIYDFKLYTPLEDNIDQIIPMGYGLERMRAKYGQDFENWLEQNSYFEERTLMYEAIAKYAHFNFYVQVNQATGEISDYWPKRFQYKYFQH